jgi:threonine dehydrogenase-like Zn-dependent dehydrogenase
VEELISHRVPLAHILDGYKLMADKAGMKVLVVM